MARLLIGRLGLPDFLVLGAQKAGTTSLDLVLRQHPGIFLPQVKEVHFFSMHAAEGSKWYQAHYTKAGWGQLRGDITPYYLFHPEVPVRIRELIPNVKLIALLRDPVERAISHYFHACRRGFETLPIEYALEVEAERLANAETTLKRIDGLHPSHQRFSYVARGHYEEQVTRYQRLFERQQLLVLKSEEFFSDPLKVLRKIEVFLGLRHFNFSAEIPRANAGAGESIRISRSIREKLRMEFSSTYTWAEKEFGIIW